MNQKASQTHEIFHLRLSRVEHSQLQDLLTHLKHIEMEVGHEEKLRFINLSILTGILEKLSSVFFL